LIGGKITLIDVGGKDYPDCSVGGIDLIGW